jgi:hypothetical protein
MTSFNAKVHQIRQENQSDVILLMRPLMSDMPAPMHFYDDPFFPFSRAIIQATRDVVCGYLFDFAAYMVQGAAGARALERSIAYAGNDTLKVIHGPFVGPAYIPMIFDNALGADAATLAYEADLPAYTEKSKQGAFIVRHGKPITASTPTYWIDAKSLTLSDGILLPIADESILYTTYTDDFAEQCRMKLEAMHHA